MESTNSIPSRVIRDLTKQVRPNCSTKRLNGRSGTRGRWCQDSLWKAESWPRFGTPGPMGVLGFISVGKRSTGIVRRNASSRAGGPPVSLSPRPPQPVKKASASPRKRNNQPRARTKIREEEGGELSKSGEKTPACAPVRRPRLPTWKKRTEDTTPWRPPRKSAASPRVCSGAGVSSASASSLFRTLSTAAARSFVPYAAEPAGAAARSLMPYAPEPWARELVPHGPEPSPPPASPTRALVPDAPYPATPLAAAGQVRAASNLLHEISTCEATSSCHTLDDPRYWEKFIPHEGTALKDFAELRLVIQPEPLEYNDLEGCPMLPGKGLKQASDPVLLAPASRNELPTVINDHWYVKPHGCTSTATPHQYGEISTCKATSSCHTLDDPRYWEKFIPHEGTAFKDFAELRPVIQPVPLEYHDLEGKGLKQASDPVLLAPASRNKLPTVLSDHWYVKLHGETSTATPLEYAERSGRITILALFVGALVLVLAMIIPLRRFI